VDESIEKYKDIYGKNIKKKRKWYIWRLLK
jgi:hypothetical protein